MRMSLDRMSIKFLNSVFGMYRIAISEFFSRILPSAEAKGLSMRDIENLASFSPLSN